MVGVRFMPVGGLFSLSGAEAKSLEKIPILDVSRNGTPHSQAERATFPHLSCAGQTKVESAGVVLRDRTRVRDTNWGEAATFAARVSETLAGGRCSLWVV